MIKKVDHIGIAVHSLENSIPFYTDILNLELLGIEEVASQKVKVAFIKAGNMKIELLEPTCKESKVANFIAKRGEGIHHVALEVESIEKRILEMETKGIHMIDQEPRLGAGGAEIAFMHPKYTGNVLYELCDKKEDSFHA
jgi:methylmalonyl-CoA/ethylmalonyl-CoA epimerase